MCAWPRGARAVQNRPGFAAACHFAGARAGGLSGGERPGGAAPGSHQGTSGPPGPCSRSHPESHIFPPAIFLTQFEIAHPGAFLIEFS